MVEDLLFRILFIVLYALFASVRLYYRLKISHSRQENTTNSDQKKPPRTWTHVVLYISILGMFLAIFLYLLFPHEGFYCPLHYPSFIRWIGVILGILSLPFLIWIHRTLGQYYSAELEIQTQHRLITIGPYSRIRHPMYTIFILFTLSTILIAANLLITIFGLLVCIMLYPISLQEEQMLITEFGDQYRDYMKRTGRFFPRLRQPESQKENNFCNTKGT